MNQTKRMLLARIFLFQMGQLQSTEFDKFFTLICTNNTDELERRLRSCSSSEQKADLSNLTDTYKAATLLMYGAFYGNKAICQLLIESGAEIFHRDKEGRNVLYYAITSQSCDVIKYLFESVLVNVDKDARRNFINNRDSIGETCLHEAVTIDAVNCVELLLKYEIDVNIVNNDGVTALHRAVDNGK